MEYFEYMIRLEECSFAGKAAMEALENPNNVRTPMPVGPQTENPNPGQGVRAESDSSLSKEQEEKVERWMKEIKAFIRTIDIDSL